MKFSEWDKALDEKQPYYESSKEIIEEADKCMQEVLKQISELPEFKYFDEKSHSLGFIQGCKSSQQFWIQYYEKVLELSQEQVLKRLNEKYILTPKQ